MAVFFLSGIHAWSKPCGELVSQKRNGRSTKSRRYGYATTVEDHRPGAYRCAKDLDPLFEAPPLEERLCLGLGRFALLKETSRDKNVVYF